VHHRCDHEISGSQFAARDQSGDAGGQGLADIRPVEKVDIAIAVVTPSGMWTRPTDSQSVVTEMSGEYVLVTLRGIPLTEEGVYGFQISLQRQSPVTIKIPVLTVQSPALAELH
jgi:hypothetical protein